MRRVLAVGLVTILLGALQIASPANACVCGGIVPPPKATIAPAGSRAIVSWDGSNEKLTMMLNLKTTSKQTGLIIPTPGPAAVTNGDRALFDRIERTIVPEDVTSDDWWGTSVFAHESKPKGVTVLRRVTLGPVDATTLAASDAQGMTTWLLDNGFLISPAMTNTLLNYVTLGWSFTAIKVVSDNSLGGTLDPITLTFSTDRLVMPTALYGLATTPQHMRLYVLDKQRDTVVQATRPTIDVSGDVVTVFAGKAYDSELTKLGAYLTVIDLSFSRPSEQLKDDVGILRSSDSTRVQPISQHYRIVTLLGAPAATLILIWVLFGIAILVTFFTLRRRYS